LAAQLIVVPLFQRHQIFCQVAGHRMNVVKALPALVVEEAEIRRFAVALEDVVARADRMGGAVGRLGWDLARGSARALRR
jgi:ornithine--oxo-acid transaminase